MAINKEYLLRQGKKYLVSVEYFDGYKSFKLTKVEEKMGVSELNSFTLDFLDGGDFVLQTNEDDYKLLFYVGSDALNLKAIKLYLFEEVELLEFLRNWTYEIQCEEKKFIIR